MFISFFKKNLLHEKKVFLSKSFKFLKKFMFLIRIVMFYLKFTACEKSYLFTIDAAGMYKYFC